MKKLPYLLLCIGAGVLCISAPVISQEVPDLLDDLKNIEPYWFLSGIGEENADSNRLNTLGFYAYEEGDLQRAAKLWRCAIDRDERNAWAHYNLACALALFAERFGRDPASIIPELEWGSPEVERLLEYADLVLHHLKQAVFYDRETLYRMQEDSDLKLIRNMDAYQFILMYPDNNPARLLEIIDTWYAPSHGVYSGGSVKFSNGSVAIESLEFDEFFNATTVVESGYYTLQGFELTILVQQPESRQLRGELAVEYDEFGFIRYFYLTIEGKSYSSTPDFSA